MKNKVKNKIKNKVNKRNKKYNPNKKRKLTEEQTKNRASWLKFTVGYKMKKLFGSIKLKDNNKDNNKD
jgi:hypothetical protein